MVLFEVSSSSEEEKDSDVGRPARIEGAVRETREEGHEDDDDCEVLVPFLSRASARREFCEVKFVKKTYLMMDVQPGRHPSTQFMDHSYFGSLPVLNCPWQPFEGEPESKSSEEACSTIIFPPEPEKKKAADSKEDSDSDGKRYRRTRAYSDSSDDDDKAPGKNKYGDDKDAYSSDEPLRHSESRWRATHSRSADSDSDAKPSAAYSSYGRYAAERKW